MYKIEFYHSLFACIIYNDIKYYENIIFGIILRARWSFAAEGLGICGGKFYGTVGEAVLAENMS